MPLFGRVNTFPPNFIVDERFITKRRRPILKQVHFKSRFKILIHSNRGLTLKRSQCEILVDYCSQILRKKKKSKHHTKGLLFFYIYGVIFVIFSFMTNKPVKQ